LGEQQQNLALQFVLYHEGDQHVSIVGHAGVCAAGLPCCLLHRVKRLLLLLLDVLLCQVLI
jgi:hypothetical protein